LEDPRGDEQRHLPPPSLWPVGFAVGIVCLLVGLIVGWVIAAIGAAIAAVFGFLWARDVAVGHREPPEPAPPELGPDGRPQAPAAPAQVGGPAAPEPEPAERFPRSTFLEASTLGLGALIGAIVTVPALGFAVLPAFVKQHAHEADLGPVGNFTEGDWFIALFRREPGEEISRRAAFIRNNGLLHGTPSYTCISNRCAHVGCPVQAGGPVFDKQQKVVKTKIGEVTLIPCLPAAGYICPCHGGTYDPEGNHIAGPPVRALDRYEFSIINGHLILGNTFSVAEVVGTGKDAKIHRYELHGPGQHVTGIESWMYPLQPPH
jgi:Rieske Fe-S protein